MTDEAAPALALRGIDKHFGTVRALAGAQLTVRRGTIHALLGENGAGKTTLMRIAFGLLRADAGVITRDGEVVRWRTPADAIRARVAMVHQHFSLVPEMTVAENVALGGRGRFDIGSIEARIREIGETTGVRVDPRARVGELPVGAQQRVELVKAFSRDATLLILDEPTAVLAPPETKDLLARLRAFADAGGAVVLITHKLRDALDAADDITVLRKGQTVFAGVAAGASEAQLVEAMVGHARSGPVSADTRRVPGDAVLRLDHVTVEDERNIVRLRDVSLSVHAGEIVAVAGVEGNGQHELLRACAGRIVPAEGRAQLPAAVSFVPEDRQRDATILDFTLTENIALAGAGARRSTLPWADVAATAAAVIADFHVAAAGPDALMRTLSGGNQQRFVLARELLGPPAALVLENPTRGLDVAAGDAVRARLRDARDAGIAIIMYSSDIDELLEIADRVVVCYGGSVHEVPMRADAIARALVGAPV